LKEIILKRVEGQEENDIFNSLITNFHYLRKPRYHGRQIKYFILVNNDVLGGIQFSDPTWTVYRRYQAYTNGEIIENSRFLLLKRIKNLGSQVLKHSIKNVKFDWFYRTGIVPRLMISYVDIERGYLGTVYKASNFRLAGKSFGKNLNRWGRNKNTSAKLLFEYKL